MIELLSKFTIELYPPIIPLWKSLIVQEFKDITPTNSDCNSISGLPPTLYYGTIEERFIAKQQSSISFYSTKFIDYPSSFA